jgi:hypothetical protein
VTASAVSGTASVFPQLFSTHRYDGEDACRM